MSLILALFLLVVTVATCFGAGLYEACRDPDLPLVARDILTSLLTVTLAASCVQPFIRFRESLRRRHAGLPLLSDDDPSRRHRWRTSVPGYLIRGVGALRSIWVVGVTFGFGWFLFMVAAALQMEYSTVYNARLRYEGKA